jgi:signal transduction histidine kinase/ActR/RegA family two-component response regulator/HPt (histidine-containing phosphotransfer) domain-containing protein
LTGSRSFRAFTPFLVLGAIAFAFLVTVVLIFGALDDREDQVRQSAREDALWAIYQFDRETAKFAAALDGVVAADRIDQAALEALALRYDILFSRIEFLNNGNFALEFRKLDRLNTEFERAWSAVQSARTLFDRIEAGYVPTVYELRPFLIVFTDLRRSTEDLLTFANARVNEMRADFRDGTSRLYRSLGFAILCLTLAMVGIVALLVRQIRAALRSRAEIAALVASLEEAAMAAEAGNRAKSAFLATIGHEIRTPLNGVLGMAAALAESRLDKDQTACLAAIDDCGRTLVEMIDSMLDFAKFEAGEIPVSPIDFELAPLIRSSVSVIEARARQRHNAISVSLAAEVPERLHADPSRLRQVLVNVLGNAVKFTENGTIRLSVVSVGRDRLRFAVEDTGIGIAPEAHHRIFKEFSQVDSSISRKFGGTGLGLSICKRIVERLGGEIGFESEPGRGSTFWFELPWQAAQTAWAAAPAALVDDAPVVASLRILVVEDNRVNQDVIRRFLMRLGHTVALADDGRSGVAAAEAERFDLILMDMHMPGMDGLAATTAIRAGTGINGRTPIVAVTANASDQDRLACIRAGMNGFLSKPVGLEQLRAMLSEFAPQPSLPGGPAPEPAPEPAANAAAASDAARVGARTDAVAMRPTASDPAARLASQDPDRRQELVEAIGEDSVGELVESFADDLGGLVAALEAAVAAADPAAIDHVLHTIAGAAANVGFIALAEHARMMRGDPASATAEPFAAALGLLAEGRRRAA